MNKQEKNNVILEMIKDHEELKSDIVAVINSGAQDKPDYAKITSELAEFSTDLKNHVKAEKKLFYDELLREMKAAGSDLSDTEEFIAEMGNIGNVIFGFAERFNKPEKIKEDFANFKKEIIDIKEILILRVEFEEAGVFTYWE